MKLSKIVVAMGLGMSLVSGMANAAASGAGNQGGGSVHFTGSIINAPCSVNPEDSDKTVELGQVANSALANKGTSTPVPFSIRLEKCDATTLTSVTAMWSGTPDSTDTKLFGISGDASGAGIALVDGANKQIAPGDTTDATKLVNGNNEIQMTAYLQGDGATSVKEGDFVATATYALSYQ